MMTEKNRKGVRELREASQLDALATITPEPPPPKVKDEWVWVVGPLNCLEMVSALKCGPPVGQAWIVRPRVRICKS